MGGIQGVLIVCPLVDKTVVGIENVQVNLVHVLAQHILISVGLVTETDGDVFTIVHIFFYATGCQDVTSDSNMSFFNCFIVIRFRLYDTSFFFKQEKKKRKGSPRSLWKGGGEKEILIGVGR